MENNLELLPLTDDYIFKRVFAYKGNESVLKDFLEALLKIEIKGIKITNPEIIPYEKGEKRGLLDIKAEINDGTILDIEMQMENERNTEERATEYIGKMISEQLQVGDNYKTLKKSIVIFIANYNFLKRNSYHNIGRMKFEETLEDEYVNMGYEKEEKIASKYIEFHYIELPKFKKRNPSKFTKLDQWMCIFTQNKEGIMLAEKENKEIKRAINTFIDSVISDIKNNGVLGVTVQHINCEKEGINLKNELQLKLKEEGYEVPILVESIGPIIGLHVGPGSIGVVYYTKN